MVVVDWNRMPWAAARGARATLSAPVRRVGRKADMMYGWMIRMETSHEQGRYGGRHLTRAIIDRSVLEAHRASWLRLA